MSEQLSPNVAFKPKSEALRLLIDRGFLHQCTDLEALDRRLSSGPMTLYAGFDATADSLHAGHLVPLMAMRWMQKLGNWPIIVIGGGTSLVGDPSFREEARPLLEEGQVASNAASIRRIIERLFDLSPEAGGRIVNNAEWLTEFRFLAFLRDYGRHFTVNRMLGFDSVKARLDAGLPMTVLEFCYMMLQAVDFLELARRFDCELQLGGSDQWGNIVNGVDLARRGDQRRLFGLTVPLLTTASGAKMGKTAAGAVWLDPERLPTFAFWQFWRNTDDRDVGRFLRLFTELPLGEVTRLSALRGVEANEAKKILANQVTAMVHGPEAAKRALEQGEALFQEGAHDGAPTHRLPQALLAEPLGLLDLLVRLDFAESNGAARRLVAGGAVQLNQYLVEDDRRQIGEGDLLPGERLVVSVGKRRRALVAFD